MIFHGLTQTTTNRAAGKAGGGHSLPARRTVRARKQGDRGLWKRVGFLLVVDLRTAVGVGRR